MATSPIQIPVYDDFTIDVTKYPRIGTLKENTDKVIIQFLLNQDYLEKVSKSFREAVTFYNECKEYYYIFKTIDGKSFKKFSAQEIIFLINQTNIYFQRNTNVLLQQQYLRRYSVLEQNYFILIKNMDFYLELFLTVQDAKYAFFQRREINYKLVPPFDFYGDVKKNIVPQVYSCQELLEINAYVQFLKRYKIIKELPEPLYVRNYFQPKVLKNQEKKEENQENKNEEENQENGLENQEYENQENNENENEMEEEIKIIHFK